MITMQDLHLLGDYLIEIILVLLNSRSFDCISRLPIVIKKVECGRI